MEDLTGKVFGRLTVLDWDKERFKKETEERKKGLRKGVSRHWLCKCSCGNKEIKSIAQYQLKSGRAQSCGCYKTQRISERNTQYSTKVNKFEVVGNKAYLYDIKNNKCIIDLEDYNIVNKWYWRMDDKGYWITNAKIKDNIDKSTLRLHQEIAKIKYGEYDTKELFPDHLDRDKSHNTKENLILKTNAENMRNRSLSKANKTGKTGVYERANGRYAARIMVLYKDIDLGVYNTFEEAVEARKQAEIEYGFTCDEVCCDYDI